MPRHIRNIVIAAFLALFALIAGINGYTHHQIKTSIDNALNSIRPLAQIKYSHFSTSLITGKVNLENVHISTRFLPEAFNIGNITLETPRFSYMVNATEKIKKGEYPEQFGFVIDDFYFDLHGETANWLDRLVKSIQPIYSQSRKLCGGKSIFSPSDYKKMGYSRLLASLRFSYAFDKIDKTLNLQLSAGTGNVGDINIDVNIANMSTSESAASERPQLTKLEINYKDQGYSARTIEYCSTLSNMEKADFINAETQQPDEYFYALWGFSPGEGLRGAYKDFLFKPDVVTLTMVPNENFNPMNFSNLSYDEISMVSAEIMDALNIKLEVNGFAINDLTFKMSPPEFTHQIDRQLAKTLDFESLLRGEEIKAPIEQDKTYTKAPPKYHKIRVNQISQYVGEYVKITTKKGSQRKGQLIRIDKTNLHLEQRVSGGKFTMTVPRKKIKSAEAFFSK